MKPPVAGPPALPVKRDLGLGVEFDAQGHRALDADLQVRTEARYVQAGTDHHLLYTYGGYRHQRLDVVLQAVAGQRAHRLQRTVGKAQRAFLSRVDGETAEFPDVRRARRFLAVQKLREGVLQHVGTGGIENSPATENLGFRSIFLDQHVIRTECVITIDFHLVDDTNVPAFALLEHLSTQLVHLAQQFFIELFAPTNLYDHLHFLQIGS